MAGYPKYEIDTLSYKASVFLSKFSLCQILLEECIRTQNTQTSTTNKFAKFNQVLIEFKPMHQRLIELGLEPIDINELSIIANHRNLVAHSIRIDSLYGTAEGILLRREEALGNPYKKTARIKLKTIISDTKKLTKTNEKLSKFLNKNKPT